MENKKTKIVSIASLVALIITVIGATYAYFVAQTAEGKSTDIKVNASTVDTFTFETGSAINLSLDQDNFSTGKGNQTGTTFAKAMLTANNNSNSATEHYYMYLNVSSNTFIYTQDENTPEILLTIKDASGNEITNISGLNYKTVKDGKGASLSGFDITTKKGLITLFNNREITTTSTKTEQWNVTATFINYDADQSANAGKSFNAKIIIQKSLIPQNISDVCETETGKRLDVCLRKLYAKSDSEITKIYSHNSSLANGAGDNSYRYAGACDEVNNFVCFGSSESPCPEDNLYRIIGVFRNNGIKLIKYDYANSNLLGTNGTYKGNNNYCWNQYQSGNNTWSNSELNTINLNEYFLESFDSSWSDFIVTTTWKVGGNTFNTFYDSTATTTYQNEITSPALDTTYDAKIGLMYVSDYAYAVSPDYWSVMLSVSSYIPIAKKENWMYTNGEEWTITRDSSDEINVLVLENGRLVEAEALNISISVRPVFYLSPTVTYESGTGTKTDPYLITLFS